MNFYGDTAAVEKAFSEWKFAGEPERSEKCVRYAIDTTSFTGKEHNDDDYAMDPLEVFYYILYPGQMPDESLEELPRWNSDGGFWDGSDDVWEYCLVGSTREHADELFRAYLPENESMFDEACVIRLNDEASLIEYLKCEALGYRGNHTHDAYPSEHMPLHHTPDVPISYKMVSLSEGASLPEGENIGLYAFCKDEAGAEAVAAQCDGERHHFGGFVVSDDSPETAGGFLVPVYDEDIEIRRTLRYIQNNFAVEKGFVLERYCAGIHIVQTKEGIGLFDAQGGQWIYPHLSEEMYPVGGEDDGYIVTVQDGQKGLIRIMGDSRMHRIVAALLVRCEYEEILKKDGDIFCVRNGREYKYDKIRDRIADSSENI